MKRMLFIAFLVGLALVPAASARKPVKPPPPPPQVVVIWPNPATAWTSFSVSGCGYPKSATLKVELEPSFRSYDIYFNELTDASGCFEFFVQAQDSGTSMTFNIFYGTEFLATATEVTA